MTRLKKIPSSLLLGIANITDVGSALFRGIALAHLLAPEQFGLAITVSVVAGIVELITDLGITPLAVRSNSAKELATLHAISILRGGIVGFFIIACAPVFAWTFHTPATTPAYIIVGVSSLIRGFASLDVDARTRRYDYNPKVICLIVSQIAWTGTSIIYASVTHDFLAMAVGVLTFMLTYVATSHILSAQPWRLAWDQAIVAESWRYGRLLALNGIANAVSSLGDRALTGAKVGLSQLAHYTALTTSALLPRAAISRYLGSVYTPHFVNAGHDDRQHISKLWVITVAMIGGTFGFGFIALGQPVTALVYGSRYQVDQALVSLVALLGAIRYMGCLPTPPVLAYGKNELLVRYTTLSMSGLAIGGGLLFIAGRLEYLLIGMCVGEAASLTWLIANFSTVLPISKLFIYKTVMGTLFLVASTALTSSLWDGNDPLLRAAICMTGTVLYAMLMWTSLVGANCSTTQLLRAVVPSKVARGNAI
ncbi:oligosaccharide flippase family protein [Lichenihabitans sp. Uapishka_5]|uniref:oligosaccharide flippase family protein n=1 Tax=Lichenihabitans sp. Uapishka_5 TaxID=3037302 RepID=UPI0029E7CF84|nr:oligosaccharide flippase family protein [Lichenihabitans sp. Uapishka_5]MDX7952331.1 oligosaccharide flippase family protein [Lichenihabitans sp. Uapishka_5]